MPRALRMEDRPRFHKDIVHLEEILDGTSQPTGLKLSLLKYMTDDFSKEREIGRGGYGVVYMGNLNNRDVAVKKLTFSNVRDKDFDREVHNLMRVKHGNIVKFLGYCNNTNGTVVNMADPGEPESYATLYNQERILCFEYVSNGSLSDHIHDELRGLQWHARYDIIKGICQALNYLHNKNFVHRDLKPDNILMDNLMSPKIADLGISKLVGASKSMTTSATATWEYAPQEFEKLGEVSVKYDIYSLGIIIIELVTGYRRIQDLKSVLTRWRHRWSKTNETLRYQQVAKCIEIGLSCQHDMPEKRPFISKIIEELSDFDGGNGTLGQKIPRWNELLWIEPPELFFPFQANKKISCSLELHNKADVYMAFFIKTYSNVKYEIEPIKGIILPRSHFSVSITLAAQEDAPEKTWNIDEFIIKSKKIIGGLTFEEITTKMFSKKSGVNVVDRITIGVVFDAKERAPCCVSDKVIPCWNAMLQVEPPELLFRFEINRRISCSLTLYNETDAYVAFYIKMKTYGQYDVEPKMGVVHPCSYFDVNITLLAQEEPPEEVLSTDNFTLKCTQVNEGLSADDITRDIFSEMSGKIVDNIRLGVVIDAKLRAPCMVQEEREEHMLVEPREISCNQEIVEKLSGAGMEEKFRDDIVLLENILDGKSEPTELQLPFLKHITDDFSEKRVIGSGGFGVVYKGEFTNRNIAVKKFKLSNKVEKDFNREIDGLMRVNHRNVVRFLGYCNETKSTLVNAVKPRELRSFVYMQDRVICFEYVSNGSLTGHLHDELRGHEWHTRYKILKDICQGLQCLHNKGMIHRDLKPDNILIDNLMVPKIADLGICKLLEDGTTIMATTNASMTWQYAPPEFKDGRVTLAYDIYSLGIIVIQLVTGVRKDPDVKNVLKRWRYRWNKSNESLKYQQVAKCIEIGLSCQNPKYKKRPSISRIIKDLDDIDGGNVAVGQEILCWNDMLLVEPPELFFPFQINKQIACSLELYNKADAHMAFFVKTNSQFMYDVDPKKGVIHPHSHITVKIKLLEQEEPPEKNWYAGEFIVKSTRVNEGLTVDNIAKANFSKTSCNIVDKMRIDVAFDAKERAQCCISEEAHEHMSLAAQEISSIQERTETLFEAESSTYSTSDLDKKVIDFASKMNNKEYTSSDDSSLQSDIMHLEVIDEEPTNERLNLCLD